MTASGVLKAKSIATRLQRTSDATIIVEEGAVPEYEVLDDVTEVVFLGELMARAQDEGARLDLYLFLNRHPRPWSGGVELGAR